MNDTGFLDLIFNLLLCFALMFFCSFLLIKTEVHDENRKNKAEYIISVTWADYNTDDVDTWLEDPLGGKVWFRNKEVNLSHLDRDDLGQGSDEIVLPDGQIILNQKNQELTSIRGFIPGEWILNVHMYNKRTKPPTIVEVTIDKLNPKFKNVYAKTIKLSEHWQEETVTRFKMLARGDIISFDPLEKSLVEYKEIGAWSRN